MKRSPGPSPFGVVALLVGAVISTATTCGPPVPPSDGAWFDTAWRDTGEPFVPDPGFTVAGSASFDVAGAGSVATVTVRTTLSERCLREVPEYSWGYPTGWLVLAYELSVAEGDTGADTAAAEAMDIDTGDTDAPEDDTGAVDTDEPDTGTSDTGAPDTGAPDSGGADTSLADTGADDSGTSSDTGADTSTSDTGAVDTGAVDTGAADTGADTSDSADTGAIDTGWGDSGDTGPYADARVRVLATGSDGSTVGDARVRLFEGAASRDSFTTERPYVSCGPDAVCELTWTMAFTLVDGPAAHGEVEAHARLNMCSSGEPELSDLTVTVE